VIGRKAEAVLNRAVRYAVEFGHEYFTLEHVLWSLLADPGVANTVRACGADPANLRRALETYLANEVPKTGVKPAQDSTPDPAAPTDDAEPGDHPVATLSIQRLIQRALFQVQSAGKDEIQPTDLLVAMFQAKNSHALYILIQEGVERLDVLNFLSHNIRKGDESEENEDSDESSEDSSDESSEGRRNSVGRENQGRGGSGGPSTLAEDPLSQFTVNMNRKAKQRKLDPLVGRANELERVIQTLCRRRKNNPLLVGEAGVGKTAIAEGLALRIFEKQVPDLLSNAVVYSLDMGSLLAGTKFRGDFEQRLKKVIKALENKREKGELPILLIDEIHTIIGAGAVSGGALDAANLLKPLLSQGELRCIGSTTYAEYRNVFEKDHALARRFQKIDVVEPTIDETVQILNGLKGRFEEHHGIIYTPEALRTAVELSTKHLTDRFLPDKAIDVIDEAGAKARLRRAALTEKPVEPESLDSPAIEEIIAQIARIPARSVSSSQKDRLKNLERDLKLTIFGQNPAVDALVTSIRLARSGLRSGDRPVGSFLFCGPTGVGKTELSKQLAHCLGVPFLRYDMSEYGERHTVSRLIGAPPGYVGFDQAGLLTDAILKNPHSVVLLDEIEKAHSEIWNILLQVMDHGTLTDSNGRKADFRNAILIMTSNVGSRDLERRTLGIGSVAGGNSAASKAVEQTFTPEFRNRLDSIVYFNPLDILTVGQVVGKHLLELESQLLAKRVEIEVGADVREWLAQKGYDRLMGARPLARLIQDKIKKPLAEEILFGKLEHGGEVQVHMDGEEVRFDIKPGVQKEGGLSSSSVERETVSSETHHD
jgi:ATP-dependent Clp protease ATP-binding subunit ClpA